MINITILLIMQLSYDAPFYTYIINKFNKGKFTNKHNYHLDSYF